MKTEYHSFKRLIHNMKSQNSERCIYTSASSASCFCDTGHISHILSAFPHIVHIHTSTNTCIFRCFIFTIWLQTAAQFFSVFLFLFSMYFLILQAVNQSHLPIMDACISTWNLELKLSLVSCLISSAPGSVLFITAFCSCNGLISPEGSFKFHLL